jgi:hypothetical protein
VIGTVKAASAEDDPDRLHNTTQRSTALIALSERIGRKALHALERFSTFLTGINIQRQKSPSSRAP